MGKKKSVTVGYKYFLGVHFALCHGPIDALKAITVDLKSVWAGSALGRIHIDKGNIFGGEKAEGGISGDVDIESGSRTQLQNDYLVSVIGSDVPAYRGICCAVLRQTYMGTNPYLKKWAFRVRRIMSRSDGTPQWYPAKAAIGNDMNPAHIIAECLTDQNWGMGYSQGDLDLTSFTVAADKLYAEGFGLSIIWDKQATIEDFVKSVLGHIDATLYVDKNTGLFSIALIRDDYDLSTAPLFNETNIVKVEDYGTTTFNELVNSVTVNFWDSSTATTSSITVQDVAMVQAQGAIVAHTAEYGGITNSTLAAKVASRDLKALSSPMIRCTAYMTREGATLKPGQVINFNWPDYGVSGVAMRVGMIDFGSATEGMVKVTLVQDVFSLGESIYAPPPATEWVPVSSNPTSIPNRLLVEAPYYTLVMNYGQDKVDQDLAGIPELSRVVAAAARPGSSSINAIVKSRIGSGSYEESAQLDYCPYGETSSIVGPTSTTIPLSVMKDFYEDMLQAGDYGVINNEIVGITGWTSSGVQVIRGVLDTVPATHAAGSKLYIFSDHSGLIDTDFLTNDYVSVKLLDHTGLGVYPESNAPVDTIYLTGRAARPYPPGNFKVDNVAFPSQITTETGAFTVSWSHRSRTQQTAGLVAHTDGNIGPEPGTTYNLRVYRQSNGSVLSSYTGLTGTSQQVTLPSGTFDIRIQLESVRGSLTSYQMYSHVCGYTLFIGNIMTEGGDTLVTEDNNIMILE